MWSHTLAVTQNNFVAENNLGGALILEDREEEAHPHFEAAARINPRDPMSRSNLGIYFQKHGQMREAVAEYETAVNLTSDPGLLGSDLCESGRSPSRAGRRRAGAQEISTSRCASIPTNTTHGSDSACWRRSKANSTKRSAISPARWNCSRRAQGYLELGRTLAQAGHVPEALDAYQQALKISPDLVEAQQAADALRQQKK